MTLTDEELDKKIKHQDTCKNCWYSYTKNSWGEEYRYCKKFQYQNGLINEKPRDVFVEDDNICDEYEDFSK